MAIKNEGKILTEADLELLPLTNEQRAAVLDDLTIKEARETYARLGREASRLRSLEAGVNRTRSHMKQIVGKVEDD